MHVINGYLNAIKTTKNYIMKHDTANSCGKKRGCTVVIILPNDSRPGLIFSRMHAGKYDLSQILSLVNFSLDKKLEKKKSLEKMAA